MASVSSSPFLRKGSGRVPASPLLKAAFTQLIEAPTLASTGAGPIGLGSNLDFSEDGITSQQLQDFFNAAIAAARKEEPIIEAGNKYSVDDGFKQLNGELLLFDIEQSQFYSALSPNDQKRASEFFKFMAMNGDLRNRNPLHPNKLDTAVLGNLMNFPKHLFGFPFAGFSTNGNEALSLALFSYRFEFLNGKGAPRSDRPIVVYFQADNEEPPADLQGCVERLDLRLHVTKHGIPLDVKVDNVAVALVGFSNPDLSKFSTWALRVGVAIHVHVVDSEIRSIFKDNEKLVHFDIPEGVRSMSLEDGLFGQAYQLYRDLELRDVHMDLPYFWQSAYLSPNEGGSGNTTPLYIDFCMMLLGWNALRDIASKTTSLPAQRLQPLQLPPYGDWGLDVMKGPRKMEDVLRFGKEAMKLPRKQLETNVVQFQRNFVGGKTRDVEALVSAGGTRSANFVFESVLVRARKQLGADAEVKLLTGNPHLLVERAGRRFQFEVGRINKDGILDVDQLKHQIKNPLVVAVYAQTLSITDGITDPLHEIISVMEEENQKRNASSSAPVTLINDCCLALSVLIHNDGKNGAKCFRVLDLTKNMITPVVVMLDAHKHIGADKGISMAMGTPGTLSHLDGHVKVGGQPSQGELARALADMVLVGVDGYHEKYHRLVAAIDNATQTLAAAGMTIIHSHNREKGSTAFGVEDPSALVQKKLKKKGHVCSPLFGVAPDHPERCQTGWLLSLTPHALREVKPGQKALDVFVADCVDTFKACQKGYSSLAKKFPECSLPAFLLSGGCEDLWLFELLRRPNLGRSFISLILRRLYSGILDSGVICSDRPRSPLTELVKRVGPVMVILFLSLLQFFRRRRPRLAKM